MKARERCSGERWSGGQGWRGVWSSLSRIFRILAEKKEENMDGSSVVLKRDRQSRGFSSAKKFIHGGVEFFG